MWFVGVCGLRFEVCGWCMGGVGGWCGGLVGGGWVVSVVSVDFELYLRMSDLCGKHSQVESVAGAAHLPNDYAGIVR